MDPVTFLINLLIWLLAAGLIFWIIRAIPLPAELAWVRTVVLVVLAVVFLIWILSAIAGHGWYFYGGSTVHVYH